MAFMNQDRKNKIAPKVKLILAKYDIKGTLSIQRNSGLLLTIRSGKIDFCQNWHENRNAVYARGGFAVDKLVVPTYLNVNTHHIDTHFTGVARECLEELLAAMNEGNWDNSDSQTDYFDKGWHCDIAVGRYTKAYVREV